MMNSSPVQQPTLPPTPPTLLPPPANGSSATAAAAASYLPPFPFHMANAAAAAGATSPEMLPKHPFLPYDFQALAAARALHHHSHHQQSPYSLPPHSLATESSRLSPVSSSRPSSSSPTSSSHHKLNSSMDLHDSDSEDEQIDVVKSAFVPILRPKLEQADSTTTHSPVQDGNTTPPPRSKCDLKAPSSRKPSLHIIAPQPQSPETKLTKPQALANGHNIAVWRPY